MHIEPNQDSLLFYIKNCTLAIINSLPLTSGIALCSQLALCASCPVGEATVIYHPPVTWRRLAGQPGPY